MDALFREMVRRAIPDRLRQAYWNSILKKDGMLYEDIDAPFEHLDEKELKVLAQKVAASGGLRPTLTLHEFCSGVRKLLTARLPLCQLWQYGVCKCQNEVCGETWYCMKGNRASVASCAQSLSD